MGQQRFEDEGGELVPVLVGGLDAQLDRVVQAEPARAFLMVAAGDRPGRVFALTRNTVLVGRSPDADVRLNDPSVSNEHARIINGGLGYEVEDLQSRNGTYVAGRRVGRAKLGNGDRLRIGLVELTFLLDGAPEATIALAPSTMNVAAVVAPPAAARRLGPLRAEKDEEGPSVEEIVRRGVRIYQVLRKHAAAVVLLVCVGVAAGLASVFAVPPPATAHALIKLQPELKSNPVELERRPQETLQFFAGAERTFMSPDLIEATLKKLGETPSEDEVESAEKRLKFEGLGDRLYAITFKDSFLGQGQRNPATFLDVHIQNYVQTEIGKTLKVFHGEVDFLRKNMTDVDKELGVISAELVKFREENADQLQDQGVTTQGTRLQMETRRSELLALMQRLQGELASEQRQLATGAPLAQTKMQGSQVYREQIAIVNRKLTEARARGLADEHPEIKRLLGERDSLDGLIEAQLKSETTSFERRSNVAYQEIQNKIESLRAQLGAARSEASDLDRSIKRLQKVATELPAIDSKLMELTEKQQANQKLRAQLFDQLKKAEIQLELERVSQASRFEIVRAPEMQKPGRLKTLAQRVAVGLFLGLAIAALVIAFREGKRLVRKSLASMGEPAEG